MASDYNKIETENALLDEIVYNCKKLMASTILKDEKNADLNENVDSLRNGNIYMSIIEGRCKFEYFSYTHMDYLDAGVSSNFIEGFMNNPNTIPNSVRNNMLNRKILNFSQDYEDLNNYYRKLSGLPNIEDTEFIYLTRDQLDYIDTHRFYSSTPIHLLPEAIKLLIEDRGLLKDIIEENPDKYYLKHINKSIDPYVARKAEKYALVYLDSSDVESILLTRYKELLEKNRVYIIKTMDFQSYDFYSDYYDRFLMMMIVVQTVIDMVNELPEYYIRRDIFDIRTIEYFFRANGVEFFPDIPIKYQRLLIKNLNRLIKYKSTSTNIVDICALFGFSNVEIFKYYLCKTRNIDENGDYIVDEDIEKEYDLKFLKVPLEELADETAKMQSNFLIYDTVVSKDPHWNGPYSHEYVKKRILEHEFNMVKSKYMSIDTVYSLTDATFELSYFINMLMYNNVPKNRLNLYLPMIDINTELNIVDIFIFLYALMYEYNGVTDDIIIIPSGYLKIKGFNFNANMNIIAQNILEKGYTLQELGVSGFQIPTNGILTFNQLVSIFINNKKIYDHLVREMESTGDRELYKIYKYIFDSLMLTDLNFDYYYIDELGRVANTYTEYLQYNNIILYNAIQNIKEELDVEKRSLNIYNTITNITSFIADYIDSSELSHIFINLPTESGEYLKGYMYKIINFFKSYKINILDIQTIYKLDKENKVYIFDDIFYQYYFIKKEIIEMIDNKKYTATFSKEDIIKMVDELIFNSLYDISDKIRTGEKIAGMLGSYTMDEYIEVIDKFKSMIASIEVKDRMNIYEEKYRYNYVYDWFMKYDIYDTYSFSATLTVKDTIALSELFSMLRIYIRNYEENIFISDTMSFISNIVKKDEVVIEDNMFINYVYS